MREGWKNKAFLDCVSTITPPAKIKRKEFLAEGLYPIVSQEADFINGYWDTSEHVISVNRPIVIFGDHTQVVKYVDFDFVAGADGTKLLEADETVNPRYLYYYLLAHPVEELGYARHFRLIKQLSIHYPESLPEQERIVSILDEAFAAIATATTNAEKNLANARELFESCLRNTFESPSSNWTESTVSKLAQHSLGKMLDKKKNRGKLHPYLRNISVRWFEFDLSDLLEMRFEEDESEKFTAVKGDLLICEGGYPGRAAIWESPDPIHFQKAIHRVRFHDPRHTEWFLYFLNFMDASGGLKQYFTGAGIQHFTGKSLAKVRVPLPPSDDVPGLVAECKSIQQQSELLSNQYSEKLMILSELKQSILHKAFTGELTADPASIDRALSEASV